MTLLKMKKHFYFFIFLLLLFLSACNKDQVLVNKLAGEWEIQQITFTADGKDSVATAPVGVFYFGDCKYGRERCRGYYELEGQARVEIGYSTDVRGYNTDGYPQLNMTWFSKAKVLFSGRYAMENFSRKSMSLSGSAIIRPDSVEVGKSYNVQIELKKK